MSDTHPTDFFVAGGTLKGNAPSYVERPADEELYQAVKRGEFCYVLTARQMGKSSLMARTARRLQAEGVQTAIIDLTQIGTVAAEQWYFDFVSEVAAELDLETDVEAWWQANAAQGIVRRFTNFLRDVVLTESEGNIVIFVDEIDFTLSLDFADDFFAAIRAVYNNRSRDANFERLTFVLMGVAAPSDLVRDQTRTPFNIGRRVELDDFRWSDISSLESGLEIVYPQQAKAILTRIHYWTHGHPYLTQKLCKAVVDANMERWFDDQTDQLVNNLFLRKEASKEDNLEFVRRNILKQANQRQLLTTYHQVYRGREVIDNERSPIINQLKLAGLVKTEAGCLQVRNEIYRRVFDEKWVQENIAIDWAKVSAITLGIILIAVLGYVGHNWWQAGQVDNATLAFYAAQTDEERREQLYIVFNPPGLFRGNPTAFRGRELFYSLTPEQQVALFQGSFEHPEMMRILVKELYETLADTDSSNTNWPVLNAMRDAFPPDNPYHQELHEWLRGRTLWREGRLDEALTHYNAAFETNSSNAAILFERARVLIALDRYSEAARDLDTVMGFAAQQVEPTISANATPTITSRPSQINTPQATEISTRTVIETLPTSTTDILVTESSVQPESTLTLTKIPMQTPTPSLTPTPAPTATPSPREITSRFRSQGEMIAAIRQLIENNFQLQAVIAENEANYPNLQAFFNLPSQAIVAVTLTAEIAVEANTTATIATIRPEFGTATAEAASATAVAATATAVQISTVAWETSDSDGDGLTNLEEQEVGTDPNNPDTDNDGLLDGVEIDRNGVLLLGTFPNNPDTDNDSLLDGEEYNGNPNSEGVARGQYTDPSQLDSDGDNIPDNVDSDSGAWPTPTATPEVNLLINGSFETSPEPFTWSDGTINHNINVPGGWGMLVDDNVENSFGPSPFVFPEMQPWRADQMSECVDGNHEPICDVFVGEHATKVFKGDLPIRFALFDEVFLPPGVYTFRVHFFADTVSFYQGEQKVWGPPGSAEIQLCVDGAEYPHVDWEPVEIGINNVRELQFIIPNTREVIIYAKFRNTQDMANNGWFLDDWTLQPSGVLTEEMKGVQSDNHGCRADMPLAYSNR